MCSETDRRNRSLHGMQKRGRERRFAWLAGSLRCVIVILGLLAPHAHGAENVVILTARGSSPYHPLGVALGRVVAESTPALRPSVQTTTGSTENLELLANGRAQIAFALGDALSDAWAGREASGFTSPRRTLRSIAALYPNYVQIVARRDARISALGDLRGKRVSVGAARSAVERNARVILAGAGLSYRQLGKVEYLPFGESIEWMKDRQLDATLQSAVLGVSGLRDLATAMDVVVVGVGADVVRKIDDPAYLTATIPANTYRGQTRDVQTVAIQNFLVTDENVPDEIVYRVTKALWNGLEKLVAAHPAARDIRLSNALATMIVPLHPGAEKFYREAGILK